MGLPCGSGSLIGWVLASGAGLGTERRRPAGWGRHSQPAAEGQRGQDTTSLGEPAGLPARFGGAALRSRGAGSTSDLAFQRRPLWVAGDGPLVGCDLRRGARPSPTGPSVGGRWLSRTRGGVVGGVGDGGHAGQGWRRPAGPWARLVRVWTWCLLWSTGCRGWFSWSAATAGSSSNQRRTQLRRHGERAACSSRWWVVCCRRPVVCRAARSARAMCWLGHGVPSPCGARAGVGGDRPWR